MSDEFQKKVEAAIKNPTNMGEMADADSIGTVGSANCGDMLRVWVKYKEDGGRKIIDKATFQSFGCETAIAAASLAMEMIKGKTADEAMDLSGEELAADLGPLPPTKVHCTALVENALRDALDPSAALGAQPVVQESNSNLMDDFTQSDSKSSGVKLVFLDEADES
ncbi:MAG: iron-sulfur cluster assembly scaffold protein [Verrucomicrobiia bacterium]|jgi:nitrogen fixation NifU-like protein